MIDSIKKNSLEFFNTNGLPSKKLENWKFTSSKNFKNFNKSLSSDEVKKIESDELSIVFINGVLDKNSLENFKFADLIEVKNLNELTKKFPKLNAYILGVIRDDKFVVMKKTDQLQLKDKAYVVVNSSQMQETLTVFGHDEKISNKMLIIGGGNIGFNLAKNIEQSFESTRVKIIEKDKSRAEYIANELNDTIVINGNGLDEDVLNEANIDEVETVLALTNDDEDNLMVSVIVEKFSKDKRTMALINKPNYSLLQSSLKIDDLIDPRMSTVSSILKHVHKGTIENAYTILNGEYEVIEADIIESSELINRQLKDSNLPEEIRIGAILRDGEVIIPSSSYVFQKDDTVLLLSKRDQLPIVENMFRISSV